MGENNIRFGYTYHSNGNKDSIRIRLTKVCDELDKLVQLRDAIQAKMEQLERDGMTNARPYWMRKDDPDGKPDQLELTHSTNSDYYQQHGTRREYIGVKPENIEAALARISRYQQHRKLKREHRQVSDKIEAIERQIKNLEYATIAKQGYW